MKISIITAVYNRKATIAHAIESCGSQSFSNIEHIIQDGGSTDGTLELARALAGPGVKVYSEADKGIYDALNKGIQRATGDVIGLLHSDDFFASESVIEKVASILERSEADGVYGDLQYVSSHEPHSVIRNWRAGEYNPSNLSRGWMPPHPTLYLKREVFERWGLYDTSFRIAADYDAILRWLGIGKISLVYIREVLVKMRLGGESNRSLYHLIRKSSEDYRALRQNQIGGARALFLKNVSKLGQFFHWSTGKDR
ncbi:glycosyltransferase family 2 protein [Lentisalinibacter sediminis]|uniref:glycosyltransferase family 2 protein n=1 Tax=Lentisalinibacter sediminis TaxID=2992237 RepID=UPI00386C6856